MFAVRLHRNAEKALRRLPSHVQKQVASILRDLKDDPYCHGSLPLTDRHDSYRIRLGDYRVIYELDLAAREILVTRIASRGQQTYR